MDFFKFIVPLVTILLIVATSEGRPGGVSQVGFSIYRNREEAAQKPLIVTYAISHPQSSDGRSDGAQVFDHGQITHQFDRHQLHQQQMETLRLTQQRQREGEAGESMMTQTFQSQPKRTEFVYKEQMQVEPQQVFGNDPYQPRQQAEMRHVQNFQQNRQESIGQNAQSGRIVIDSIPLPKPMMDSPNGHHHAKSEMLDLNEVLDGNVPVQYY